MDGIRHEVMGKYLRNYSAAIDIGLPDVNPHSVFNGVYYVETTPNFVVIRTGQPFGQRGISFLSKYPESLFLANEKVYTIQYVNTPVV